jgi:hypothetical protein
MTATLTLTREGFGIELRRGHFDAIVDGEHVATIDYRDTIDLPVEPGHHTLQMRVGRYSSPPHSFDAVEGETVAFQLHGANLWPVFVVSLVKTDWAIMLKRVDA